MDNRERRRSNRLKTQTTKRTDQKIIGPSIPDLDVTHEQVESSDAKLEKVDSDIEWLDREDHPLFNKVILGIVFKHLRGRDLKKSRLVCKAWNVSTIPFIRNTFPITIYGNDSEKQHKIGSFVELFRSNTLGIPFGRFKLGSFPTTNGAGKTFLQLCGDTIKSLEFLPIEKFKVEDVSQLLKLTPKLERFQIPKHLRSHSGLIVKLFPDTEDSKPRLLSLNEFRISSDNPQGRNTFCPTFLEELITAAPNITCFDLCDSFPLHWDNNNAIFSSFEVLTIIEKLGRESCIQELVILCYKNRQSAHFELLSKMIWKPNGLKLKRFEYSLVFSGDKNQAIQLASTFKDTLEDLKLPGWDTTSFMEFPRMSRLKRLSINLPNDFNSRFVDLNKIFPVLRQLNLQRVSDQFIQSDPCPTIKSLKLFSPEFTINGFNRVLNIFPHLTKLQMEIYNNCDGKEILRQIFSHMTQLESLSISSGIIEMEGWISMDYVLTGIPTHALQHLQVNVCNLKEMATKLDRKEAILNLRSQHVLLPSIVNLTRLRSLTLELSSNENWEEDITCMTDFTAYLGFYSMPRLKHITVQCQFTKTCCEILTKEMELESWSFKTWQSVDVIPSSEIDSEQ